MILDELTTHIDFNIQNNNNAFSNSLGAHKIYIPYQLQKEIQEKYRKTLSPYNYYFYIIKDDSITIIGINQTSGLSSNDLKLNLKYNNTSGTEYCVSLYKVYTALYINTKDYTYQYDDIKMPCLPLSLYNNYMYNYYTALRGGYGYEYFTLGNNYIDDITKSNKTDVIFIDMLYIFIPVFIFILALKVFKKGLFK